MSDWQTIDSAPKDGTWILVYEPDGHTDGTAGQYVVTWYLLEPTERFVPAAVHGLYRREEVPWEGWWHGAEHSPVRATHWQPLPAPPLPEPGEE